MSASWRLRSIPSVDRSAADPVGDRGSAPVDSIFAIGLLLLLAIGVMEVAFALYGRNVVLSSAHEGARAAVELGRTPSDAIVVARRVVARSAGALVDELDVDVRIATEEDRSVLVVVDVSGVVRAWGPVPMPVPVSVRATASRDASP